VGQIKAPKWAKSSCQTQRGVVIYTHVSHLWIPFYTQVITCHARQASFVLDGLLYHGTRLEPKEHYTDTHGFTECLFSLAHVLGIRFCPRIKDLPEQRLWRPDDGTRYQNIEPVFAGKLKTNRPETSPRHFSRPLGRSHLSTSRTTQSMLAVLGHFSFDRRNFTDLMTYRVRIIAQQ